MEGKLTKEKEFWSSILTEKSWQILQQLKREYNFVLIGGWAVFLLTRQKKSKDIDIVVGINELQKLKKDNLTKNEKLKKYEIKKDEIDIDIYVEYFSKLIIPPEDIKNYTIGIEGFNVLKPEVLLILKQNAYNDRKYSVKGEKDLIDIVSLIFFSEIDFKGYKEILLKYNTEKYIDELINIIANFNDYSLFDLNPKELKTKKNIFLKMLKRL